MNEFFQMLKKDPKEVKGILAQLEETGNKSKKRDELFQKLKEELVPHMKAKGQDQWAAKLSVFKELLEHHIKEEEGTIFKTAEKVLSQNKFQSILKQFVEEKQKFKENLQ